MIRFTAERIRLLSTELDYLRQSALERTRSIDTKSSFVVVAAGVIAGATFNGLVTERTWFAGVVPLILTVATIVMASIALWPTKVDMPSGRQMVTWWVEGDLTADELEDSLLEVKAKEIELRDGWNEKKAAWTKRGFILLLASVVTALIVVTLNAAVPEGSPINGKTVVTAPVPTDTP